MASTRRQGLQPSADRSVSRDHPTAAPSYRHPVTSTSEAESVPCLVGHFPLQSVVNSNHGGLAFQPSGEISRSADAPQEQRPCRIKVMVVRSTGEPSRRTGSKLLASGAGASWSGCAGRTGAGDQT